MSTLDFRDFLKQQEKNDELIKVGIEVDTLDEMGAFVSNLDYSASKKSVLFENPKGFDIPVYANTVGCDSMAIAKVFDVGSGGDGVLPNIAQKTKNILQSGGVAPEYVDKENAACKEIIMTGNDIDLSILPVPRCNPEDGKGSPNFLEGRFITNPCVSKPTPDAYNLSYHRFEITDKSGGSIWIYRGTGDAISMQNFWGSKIDDPEESYNADKGKAFPIAFVFGVTPQYIVTGAHKALPHESNDFNFIGGLAEEAVKLVKCESIDVDVPANAEVVVEGIMKPFNWTTQGTFASFNGFYDVPRRRPIFDVTAITMRKKPIFQYVHIGRPLNECNNLAGFFRGVLIYNEVKAVMPNLVDVHIDPAAGIGFTVHLSIKKARIGEPKLAMMRAYTALQGFCKHVFVYDDDVDIHDPHDRNWALAHRFMADRDLMVIPNVLGMNLDPLAQGVMGTNSKLGVYDGYPEMPLNVRAFMGVDCTNPTGLKVMDRVMRDPKVEIRVEQLMKESGLV